MPQSEEFQNLLPFSSQNPYLRFLGIHLLDAGKGWVHMSMPFREEFLQPHTIHGGAIYSLADSAAAHAVMTVIYPQEYATTVEQRINFLKAPRSQDLFADGRLIHMGSTLAYTEVSLTTADGTLIARSTATQMRLDPSRWSKPALPRD